ncbi:MAG: hypothetical protein M3P27_00630 [Acidobacteriota bacterium]|nr:hypothetical protein [Acidobacteriota bacterium]
MTPTDKEKDSDLHKGAVESEDPNDQAVTSMAGQLGHRDQDPLIKSSDSDFPEPGESPEHSGEPEGPNLKDKDTLPAPGHNSEGGTQVPEPGIKQRNDKKKQDKKDGDAAA